MQGTADIELVSTRAISATVTRTRINLAIAAVLAMFCAIVLRLVLLGMVVTDASIDGQSRAAIQAGLPLVTDRNGIPMALDVRVPSLFAEPRRIIDVEEVVQKLGPILPDLDPDWLRGRLSGDRGFVWLKRELTPAIEDRVMQLGLPGLDFITESRRFYPAGAEAAHILGGVDIDNRGIAGIQLRIDRDLSEVQAIGLGGERGLSPVALSIDMRVQHIMRTELQQAITRFRAIAGAGVMLDVTTGEILALVSLPDFDPNDPRGGQRPEALNRITAGVYELGSTFKTITLAAALDAGAIGIADMIDARQGVRYGRFTLNHGKHQILSVADVFRYSDNIGTIRIMQALGKDNLRAFLTRAGFDSDLAVELPERARSQLPAQFSEVGSATASYGYGFSVTPLHMASALGGLVNNGNLVPPTLFRRSLDEAQALARPIVSPQTSADMRYLLRNNGLQGSGRVDQIARGFRVGGKTGTAEKVVNGGYSKTLNLTLFTAVFPIEAPRYALLVMLDEAKAETETGARTAGWNSAEVSGQIIQRSAPLLGVAPRPGLASDAPQVIR